MAIEIWTARLDRALTPEEESALMAALPPQRLERLERLKQPEKRREPLCAYLLLRRALWEQYRWRDLPEIARPLWESPIFPPIRRFTLISATPPGQCWWPSQTGR